MRVIQKSAPLLAVLILAGCSDPGSRALLKGEKLMQQGRYAQAAAQLETATRLLPRSAQAWNHFGLALHYQRQFPQAQQAYRQALAIDHNLASARFNLGLLFFEHNDFMAASDQLTSYTLLHPRSLEGWLKLGSAQLQTRRYDAAERSFRAALEINPGSCEALNGLGNVQFYRRRTQDALNYFNRALTINSNYAPAVLNAAIVAHQSLNNRQQALQGYRNYLAINQNPPNGDAVAAAASQLERELAPPPAVVAVKTNPPPPAPRPAPPPAATSASPILVQRPAAVPTVASKPVSTQLAALPNRNTQAPPRTAPTQPEIEVTRLPDDLVIRPVQDIGPHKAPSNLLEQAGTGATPVPPADGGQRADKRGLLARLNPFNGAEKVTARGGGFPRYTYLSPPKPTAGNRKEAEKHFAAAVTAQRGGQLKTAVAGYKKAVEADPAYFEAHYNRGLAAYQLGNWQESLRSYEYALALRPDSLDARYNFALALKAANHADESAQQLNQILRSHPDESRAHFTLGSLYAYKYNRPDLARQHFTKVLQSDPQYAQASEIRFWLARNP